MWGKSVIKFSFSFRHKKIYNQHFENIKKILAYIYIILDCYEIRNGIKVALLSFEKIDKILLNVDQLKKIMEREIRIHSNSKKKESS